MSRRTPARRSAPRKGVSLRDELATLNAVLSAARITASALAHGGTETERDRREGGEAVIATLELVQARLRTLDAVLGREADTSVLLASFNMVAGRRDERDIVIDVEQGGR